MPLRSSTIRKALVAGALVVGTTAGAAGIAAAATSGSTSTNSSGSSSGSSGSSGSPGSSGSSGSSGSTAPSGASGASGAGLPGNPAAMTHGPNETLLTGTDQQKADAAATAAEPGATIVRAETDSSGAGKYEVHMKKADGSYVTVYLDANFKVTGSTSGFGGGPGGNRAGGQGGPGGASGSGGSPPAGGSASNGSSSSTSA